MRNQLWRASYQPQEIGDVQQEKDRTEDRSFWNPMRDWQWQRGGSSCTDELRAAGQVRREALKDSATETTGRSPTLQH